MFDTLADRPPLIDMYAAVNEVKPRYSKRLALQAKEFLGDPKKAEQAFNEAYSEMAPFIGAQATGIPDEVRASMEYAAELKQKMGIQDN